MYVKRALTDVSALFYFETLPDQMDI